MDINDIVGWGVALIVVGFLLWKNRAYLAGLVPGLGSLLARLVKTGAATPPVVTPPPGPVPEMPPAATSSIDYAKWGGDWTPYRLQTLGGPFAGGLPPGWDWGEWARVNGKVDPRTSLHRQTTVIDRTGYDLGVGGAYPKVNRVVPGQWTPFYNFTASDKRQQIQTGGPFGVVSEEIYRGDEVIWRRTKPMSNHNEVTLYLEPGQYRYRAKPDMDGELMVDYKQHAR